MLFRNVASVIALYVIFLGIAYRVLPHVKLPAFVFFALPGVVWGLADAVDLAGMKAGKNSFEGDPRRVCGRGNGIVVVPDVSVFA